MPVTLSTEQLRRPAVVDAAIITFASGGFFGVTVADIARQAGISPAYVFKMYGSKEAIFVVALDECFTRICQTLSSTSLSDADSAAEKLDALGGGYADLIADRSLLLLQVHAQSAASTQPAIATALRAGLARVLDVAAKRSEADPAALQRFMAYGQLCHLVAVTGTDGVDADWARTLSAGIRH